MPNTSTPHIRSRRFGSRLRMAALLGCLLSVLAALPAWAAQDEKKKDDPGNLPPAVSQG